MAALPDLAAIVRGGLCAGCGLCESLAGVEHVEMRIASSGHIRPAIKGPIEPAIMERIHAVCPGITLRGPDAAQAGPNGTMHEVFGPIRALHRGWATDAATRYRSAAGGGMTALGVYLLELARWTRSSMCARLRNNRC